MYLIFRENKAKHLKHKVHELKELACEVLECLAEAREEHDDVGREESRRFEMAGRYSRDYEDKFDREDEEGYGQEMSRSGSGGGRSMARRRY